MSTPHPPDTSRQVTADLAAGMRQIASLLGLDPESGEVEPVVERVRRVVRQNSMRPTVRERSAAIAREITGAPAEPREGVGRFVRQVWIEWAREQPDAKPSWLTPWEHLDAGQREVHMRIGAALFDAGQRSPLTTTAPNAVGMLWDILLDVCGFQEGAESAEGSAENDLACERAHAVIRAAAMVRRHSWPDELFQAHDAADRGAGGR